MDVKPISIEQKQFKYPFKVSFCKKNGKENKNLELIKHFLLLIFIISKNHKN